MYKLLIVDDEALMRQGILKLLNLKELNIHEVYEASNGLQGLELFELHKPQIVLIDINMPKMNGLELAKRIKDNAPETRIAIITGYDYFDYKRTLQPRFFTDQIVH